MVLPQQSQVTKKKGRAGGWREPCGSTSGFFLESDRNVKKIFATNQKWGAFRIPLVPATSITCTFTMDNQVDSVFYHWQDITTLVKGDFNNWKGPKTLTVPNQPGAYLVISGSNFENDGKACKTAGFAISCSNGITSAWPGWQSFGSDVPISGGQKMGLADGWGDPCSSSSGFYLSSDRSLTKIFATNKKYGAFRVRLSPLPFELTTTTTTTTNTALLEYVKELKLDITKKKSELSDQKNQIGKLQGKLKKETERLKSTEDVLSATREEKDRWKVRTHNMKEIYEAKEKQYQKLEKKNNDLFKTIQETRTKKPGWKEVNGGWDVIEAHKKEAAMAKQELGIDSPLPSTGSPAPAPPPATSTISGERPVPGPVPPASSTSAASGAAPEQPVVIVNPPPTTSTGSAVPAVPAVPAIPAVAALPASSASGPPHWTTSVDPHTGRTIYTSVETGVATTEKPQCWGPAYYTTQQPCVCR